MLNEIPWYPIILLALSFLLFILMAIVSKGNSGIIKNIGISFAAVCSILLILESVFYFIPKSRNYGKTLSMDVWKKYYWHLNSDGCRDEEFSKKDSTKKKIVFIGDSFTVGQGIKNPAARFSNLIGTALRDSFEFYNMGVTGSNTDVKTDMINSLKFKPDVVIYEYFVDDIIDTRIKFDDTRPSLNPYINYPAWLSFVIDNSYLINYLYWEYPHLDMEVFKRYLKQNYDDHELAAKHEKVVGQMFGYAKASNIKFVFVNLPFPTLFDYSNQLTEPIEQIAKDSSITVINLTRALDTIPLNEIVVNKCDFHLNEKGNKIVAQVILEEVFGINNR